MAGPVVDVLLRAPTSRATATALLHAACGKLGFRVTPTGSGDAAAVARVDTTAGFDFEVLLLPADHEREPGELEFLTKLVGYRPQGSIQILAWVRSRPDRDVGRLALGLLTAGAGDFVELDGPIQRGSPGSPTPDADATRHEDEGRPGRVLELPYQTALGQPAVIHLDPAPPDDGEDRLGQRPPLLVLVHSLRHLRLCFTVHCIASAVHG